MSFICAKHLRSASAVCEFTYLNFRHLNCTEFHSVQMRFVEEKLCSLHANPRPLLVWGGSVRWLQEAFLSCRAVRLHVNLRWPVMAKNQRTASMSAISDAVMSITLILHIVLQYLHNTRQSISFLDICKGQKYNAVSAPVKYKKNLLTKLLNCLCWNLWVFVFVFLNSTLKVLPWLIRSELKLQKKMSQGLLWCGVGL